MKARPLVVEAVLVGAVLCVAGVPRPAVADPIRQCTTTTGVIVAVDFAHFGGHIERGCDATPTTGYDALHAAGFTTEGDAQDGPAFVCRIDGYPTPDQEPCTRTPSRSSYWSYWYANAGRNQWSYSPSGADSFHPKPGSVDAWVYGATNQSGTAGRPTFSPASVRATNAATSPTPMPTVTHHSSAAPRRRASAAAVASATPVAGRHRPPPHPAPSAAGRGRGSRPASLAAAASPSPTADSSGPVITDASPPARRIADSHGSATGTVIGVALAAVVAAAAGVAAWRRRHRSAP